MILQWRAYYRVSLSDFGRNFCALILLVDIYVVQNYVLSSPCLEPDHLISWVLKLQKFQESVSIFKIFCWKFQVKDFSYCRHILQSQANVHISQYSSSFRNCNKNSFWVIQVLANHPKLSVLRSLLNSDFAPIPT